MADMGGLLGHRTTAGGQFRHEPLQRCHRWLDGRARPRIPDARLPRVRRFEDVVKGAQLAP